MYVEFRSRVGRKWTEKIEALPGEKGLATKVCRRALSLEEVEHGILPSVIVTFSAAMTDRVSYFSPCPLENPAVPAVNTHSWLRSGFAWVQPDKRDLSDRDLFHNPVDRETESACNARPIFGVGVGAIDDVALLNLHRCASHGPRCVFE